MLQNNSIKQWLIINNFSFFPKLYILISIFKRKYPLSMLLLIFPSSLIKISININQLSLTMNYPLTEFSIIPTTIIKINNTPSLFLPSYKYSFINLSTNIIHLSYSMLPIINKLTFISISI